MQKLANNREAMQAFRAFLKVIIDEGAFLFLLPFFYPWKELVLEEVLIDSGFI